MNVSQEHNIGALLNRHPELQIERDVYNINVTANYGELLTAEQVFDYSKSHDGAGKPAHLYFHIPFCAYICHFCSYVKTLLPSNSGAEELLDKWTDLLIQESSIYLKQCDWVAKAKIESLFIGGGTAALLRERHLTKIINHVRENYSLSNECELTIEGNPDNFMHDEIEYMQKIGFNRFSVGVQSLQDEVINFVGRKHSRALSLQAIQKLKSTKMPFNVDIMFGLPHQTVATVADDVQTLISLNVPTITIYRLRNADREKMGIGNRAAWNNASVRDKIEKDGLFPSLNETYAMREAIVNALLTAGYYPSPCGWWSAPNTYPEGNIPGVSKNKWQHYHSMIAFGPGAYGWLTGSNGRIIQTHNNSKITGYAKHMETQSQPPLAFGRLLEGPQAVGSALGFAYKANQPIELSRFKREFGVDLFVDEPFRSVLLELIQKGLLSSIENGAAFLPTLEGEALHEEVISVYMHERIGSFANPICKR